MKNVTEAELFAHMIQRFNKQSEINDILKRVPTTFKKDVAYNNGSRASYEFDPTTKGYREQPSEIIMKKRIDDINVKCAGKQRQFTTTTNAINMVMPVVFSSDIRISTSSERPIDQLPKA